MDIRKLLEENYEEKEIEIIEQYLSGKSIRQIAEENKNFGRTRIRNLIEKCCSNYPQIRDIMEKRLFQNRYHKKDGDSLELEDLTEEQVKQAYEDIKEGKTLTEIAKVHGRTRDFIKNRIIEYINDEEEEKEFLDLLKSNQHPIKKDVFLQMSEEEKKKVLFEKLNRRREKNNREKYSETFLERKYERLKKYFLETRNEKMQDDEKISEEQLFKILYDTPTLLSSSLSNRIIPAMENLDNNENIGISMANKIIKTDASILCSSIERTNLQIRILKDNELLEKFLQKPRNFRTSPEMIYALIQLHKAGGVKDNQIFITKSKLQKKYEVNPEEMLEEFDIKQKYGEEPYFDR